MTCCQSHWSTCDVFSLSSPLVPADWFEVTLDVDVSTVPFFRVTTCLENLKMLEN